MKKDILILCAAAIFIAACHDEKTADAPADKKEAMMATTENKAEKNRQTALASVMGVAAHDADIVLKDATNDGADYGDGSMPPVRSMDSVKMAIKAWINAFPDIKGENVNAFSNADGSMVTVVGTWTGTFKNDFMGMKATGKSYKVTDADIFTFNDEGKITSHRSIYPNRDVWMQVGAQMTK